MVNKMALMVLTSFLALAACLYENAPDDCTFCTNVTTHCCLVRGFPFNFHEFPAFPFTANMSMSKRAGMMNQKLPLPSALAKKKKRKKKKKQAFAEKLKTMFGEGQTVTKQSAKNKLRAIVRFVMNHTDWMSDVDTPGETADPEKVELREEDIFPLQEKLILLRPPEMRTAEEIQRIVEKMSAIKSIRANPKEVVRELAAVVTFNYYKKDSVVIKQGHPVNEMSCLYYLIKGKLDYYQKKSGKDPDAAEEKVGERVEGEMFGEVGLLHNIPRPVTIIANTNVQVLVLKCDDFHRILRDLMWNHWHEMFTSIESLSYSKHWTQEQKSECCGLAEIKTFQKDQVIIAAQARSFFSTPMISYFILKGKCHIIGTIVVRKQPSDDGRSTEYTLHQNQDLLRFTSSAIETIILKLCTLSVGQAFSVGEDLYSRQVIASEVTKCLVVPHKFLLSIDHNNFWDRNKTVMDSIIPSVEKQLEWFVNSIKSKQAKEKLLSNIKRSDRSARLTDIPITIRARLPVRVEDFKHLPPKRQHLYNQVEALVYEMGKLSYNDVKPNSTFTQKISSSTSRNMSVQ